MGNERIEDGRPPHLAVKASTLVLRPLLRSGLGARLPRLALLEVRGRRTGRRYRVVTGWYEADGGPAVFTPARWRVNFAGGTEVDVWHGGRKHRYVAHLETDADEVARALNAVIAAGTAPRSVGLRAREGQLVTADDVRRLDRALVRFARA